MSTNASINLTPTTPGSATPVVYDGYPIVSVSTTNVTIDGTGVPNGALYLLVAGQNTARTAAFFDVVVSAYGTVFVLSSSNVLSPAARTYSIVNFFGVQMKVASDTFNVSASATKIYSG